MARADAVFGVRVIMSASWLGWIERAGGVGHPGEVDLSSSGEGDVGVVPGGTGFEDGEADVDGVALVAVAGDGPAELDVASRRSRPGA